MPHSGLTLVTFAVRTEAGPFQKRLPARSTIRVVLTGIGPERARQVFDFLIAPSQPALVVSAGFAGGLNPQLAGGDVLFETRSSPHLAFPLKAAGAIEGRFTCVRKVAVTATEKTALRAQTGADAVEMESGVLLDCCRAHDIPCVVVRVISDTAQEDLPLDFNQVLDAHGRLLPGAFARALLRHPSRLARLARFQPQVRRAARRLSQVLLWFLKAIPAA